MIFETPDVYTSERKASAGPVAGVSTSTYATGGWLRKGPLNEARLVTSYQRLLDTFGGPWRNSYVPFQEDGFFLNEGGRSYVFRVVPSDAAEAANTSDFDSAATAAEFITRPLTDPIITLDATHYNINLDIDDGGAADVDVTGDLGVAGSYALSAIVAILDAIAGISASLVGSDRIKIVSDNPGSTSELEFKAGTANSCLMEFCGLKDGGTYTYTGEDAYGWGIISPYAGAWYNQVRMTLSGDEDYAENGSWTRFDVLIEEESELGEADWETKEDYQATVLDDDTSDDFVSDIVNDKTDYCKINADADYGIPRTLRSIQRSNEFVALGDAATKSFSGTLIYPEVHPGSLSIVHEAGAGDVTITDDGEGVLSGTGVTGTIDYETGAWTLEFTVAPGASEWIYAGYYTVASATSVTAQLAGGTDGTGPITRNDISVSTLQANKEGIYCLDAVDEILNIGLSDFAGVVAVGNDLIAYAENRGDRFSILSVPLGKTPVQAKSWINNVAQWNTSYAALYYPWVTIADPLTVDSRPLNIPQDGFIAGVYARTDKNRNVGKAPAGINEGRLNGIIGLERNLDQEERKVVSPARINILRADAQTGRAVWGARTLSKDTEWQYIQARRLFIFVRKSLYNASFWAVFENNGPALWARIKAQYDGFLKNLFENGYFAGTTPAEAWLVKVDSDNNPQSAIDTGLLTVDVYIAPNKPAEFVHIRHQQLVKAAA